jgi:hypothetical protein
MRTLACILLSSSLAGATDRFFSDESATSPSGKLRLEAKSPDNEGRRRAFASHFRYTLYEADGTTVRWVHEQPMKKEDGGTYESPDGEGSPSGIWLADDGLAVVYTGWQELFLLEGTKGEKIYQTELLAHFPPNERKDYVHDTTAGPMWTGMSRWSFLDVKREAGEADRLFVIRPWWGTRLFVDLRAKNVQLADGAAKAWHAAADEADRAWVKVTLAGVGELPRCEDGKCGPRHEAEKAAWLAGVLGLKEAVDAIHKMEKDAYCSSSTMGGRGLSWRTCKTRQIAHLALRRLGEAPKFGPAIRWRLEGDLTKNAGTDEVVATRKTKVSEVKAGMKLSEVVAQIGHPDYQGTRDSFEYDIDAETPFTLRLVLDEAAGTVQSVERIEPPVWKSGLERDEEIAN